MLDSHCAQGHLLLSPNRTIADSVLRIFLRERAMCQPSWDYYSGALSARGRFRLIRTTFGMSYEALTQETPACLFEIRPRRSF
jgi:hypothetical protein